MVISGEILTSRVNAYSQTHSDAEAAAMIGKPGDKKDVSTLYGVAEQAYNSGHLAQMCRENLSEIDCMQDIVIKLLAVIDAGRLSGGCYYYYLRRVAYNVLNDILRKQFSKNLCREKWVAHKQISLLRARGSVRMRYFG